MLIVDGFATFFRVLVIGVGMLAVLSSTEYLRRENSAGGEFYALILFSIVGQCIMAHANELIMIFIGLEISSIASYILAGYLRDDPRNNEIRAQVFSAGIVRHRVSALRRRLDLRHHRLHQPGRDPPRAADSAARRRGAGRRRRGADVRRLRLQDFRRALPDLGARRLSGRARARSPRFSPSAPRPRRSRFCCACS